MNTYKALTVRICAALLAAMMLFSFASCSNVAVLASDGNGGYQNNKTDISYRGAPLCYEAKSYLADQIIAQEIVGEDAEGNEIKIPYYAIEGADPDKYLWSPDFEMLLYARDITLPTLEEMAPNGMYICIEEDSKMKTAFEIKDREKIDAILNAYENGETLDYSVKNAYYSFHLKFYSDETPWLLYNLLYVQFAEDHIVYGTDENGEDAETNYGKNFIYNRSEDRFVAIGEELQEYIDEYYRNTEDGDGSDAESVVG